MPRIMLRHHDNADVDFVHIINLLVNYRVMPLAEAASLFKQFKAGQLKKVSGTNTAMVPDTFRI